MNAIISTTSAVAAPVPAFPVSTRVATTDDLPFLDGLQKQHHKALGFFPRAQMEGYVRNGWVLIAQDVATRNPVGYCASRDRYLKRDELGVIYQLCVVPGEQRKLVGASLLRAVFGRSPYGCRLYCCWCAQDLSANYFWESMGFAPIAFRAGSDRKRRVHIFWQRRINADDATTPYWYPCQTNGGAIREDRLVFPIPPSTHWKEVEAVALPARALPNEEAAVKRKGPRPTPPASDAPTPHAISMGGLSFAQPLPPKAKRARTAAPKVKADPQLVAKARELRDRCMERVNDRMLIAPQGKYDVSRMLIEPQAKPAPLLKAG